MNIFAELSHYSTIALTVGITSIGVGIGEGLSSHAALQAIDIQPHARADITKAAIMGMALIETAAIMSTFVAILLIMPHIIGARYIAQPFYTGIAQFGIAFAICIPGFVIGIVSSLPTRAACIAIARQPFFSQTIVRFMLMTQSLIQTPIIFVLIVALFLKD